MPDDKSANGNHIERIKMLESGFREMATAFLAVNCEVSALQILLSKQRIIGGEQLQSEIAQTRTLVRNLAQSKYPHLFAELHLDEDDRSDDRQA